MTNTTRFAGVAGFALMAVLFTSPLLASADTLYRQLQVGSTGSDVGSVQSFLAQDASLYPQAKVTNYFGSLTSAAVARFQTRNGISAVGRVGPVTMIALNAQMAGGINGLDMYAPDIRGTSVTANNNSASVSWTTNELARGIVYYSTSPLSVSETLHNVTVYGTSAITDTNLHSSQMVSLQGLQGNTTYYYTVYASDAQGNVSVTWPSTFRTN